MLIRCHGHIQTKNTRSRTARAIRVQSTSSNVEANGEEEKKEKGGPQRQGVEMRNERGGGGGSGPNATVLVLQAAEMESGLLAFERWAGPFSHKSHANMYSGSI